MKSPAEQQMLMNNPLENENQLLGMVEGFFDFSNEEEDGMVEDVATGEAEVEAKAGKSVDSTTAITGVSSVVDFSSNSSGSGSAAGNGDLCHSDELLFLVREIRILGALFVKLEDVFFSPFRFQFGEFGF